MLSLLLIVCSNILCVFWQLTPAHGVYYKKQGERSTDNLEQVLRKLHVIRQTVRCVAVRTLTWICAIHVKYEDFWHHLLLCKPHVL